MRNLAGGKDSDIYCAAELTAAGIGIEVVDTPYGEPQARVVGRLGGVKFHRAWYYWVAKGKVPRDVARRLYADPIGQRDVRVAGHCGRPPPEPPWVEWFDGEERVVLDPDGTEEAEWDAISKQSKLLMAKDKPRFVRSADGLQGYITLYHIDSAEGLKLFADAIRGG